MGPHSLSIVVPFLNEEGAVKSVIIEIFGALRGFNFEVIAVDDGSSDNTAAILKQMAAEDDRIRVIRHRRRAGQSSAIRSGVKAARHAWIATLDGDGQNPPDQILRLIEQVSDADCSRVGIVQGERAVRQDTLAKRWGSRIANTVRSTLLNDGTRDSGCGLKLFRRNAYLDLPFFDHLHRFMPAMMLREGWEVRFVDVSHRPREFGRSNYSNLNRTLVGLVDLVGVLWLIKRRSPLNEKGDTPS